MSLAAFVNGAIGYWKHRGTALASQPAPDRSAPPDLAHLPPDARRLIRDRRYAWMLGRHCEIPFAQETLASAWRLLECEMALVPGGQVCLETQVAIASHGALQLEQRHGEFVRVGSLYCDRFCVSNANYESFVRSGGYGKPDYWPEEVWPIVLRFVDSTGHPGPQGWTHGLSPKGKENHPVVGICWYEAKAYAAWAGKHLPTAEQWQRAATWSRSRGDAAEPRYPWGNGFDPAKANTWASHLGGTVAVDALAGGDTPNGIRQLIGNVWQWVDGPFQPRAEDGVAVRLGDTMAELRGGAYDTYFPGQATCQFRTGQSVFYRGPNVGFRCCIAVEDLMPFEPCARQPDVSQPDVSQHWEAPE